MTLLLNWLVQGSILTLIVAATVRASQTLNAATRESVWWLSIGGVLAMPLAGLCTASVGVIPTDAAAPSAPFPNIPDGVLVQVTEEADKWLPYLVAGWAIWAVVGFSRVGTALVRLRRAKRDATPLGAEFESRLSRWAAVRDRGRPTRLVMSSHVRNAGVLGLGDPLIALAPTLVERLTDSELDEVVLHEYAHVQRRDDLAMLAQRLVWVVAGLHPAIWWLDRALTVDREVACDDSVLARSVSARGYAACLLSLAVNNPRERSTLEPRAGVTRALVTIRVTRLLDVRRNATPHRSVRTLLAGGLAITALTAALVVTLVAVEPAVPLPRVRPAPATPSAFAGIRPQTVGAIQGAGPPIDRRSTSKRAPTASAAVDVAAIPGPVFENRSAARPAVEAPEVLPTSPIGAQILMKAVPDREHPGGAASVGRVDRGKGGSGATPWGAAADFGVAVGATSRGAAQRAADFFTRAGKSIGGSF
jgi:beta-lactamase regulating signal transducer with metallopeptidase domain